LVITGTPPYYQRWAFLPPRVTPGPPMMGQRSNLTVHLVRSVSKHPPMLYQFRLGAIVPYITYSSLPCLFSELILRSRVPYRFTVNSTCLGPQTSFLSVTLAPILGKPALSPPHFYNSLLLTYRPSPVPPLSTRSFPPLYNEGWSLKTQFFPLSPGNVTVFASH